MRMIATATVLAVALAACGRGDTTKIQKDEPYGPSRHAEAQAGEGKPARAPFEGCRWEEISVRDVGLWSQVCANGQLRVGKSTVRGGGSYDALLYEQRSPTGEIFPLREAVVLFPTTGGGLDALTQLMMAQGAAPAGATCRLEPTQAAAPTGRKRYTLTPTGATKIAWERAVTSDTVPEQPPCGTFGIAPVGDRYVEIQDARPDTAIFVELGSEIQIYEPDSIAFVSAEKTAANHDKTDAH